MNHTSIDQSQIGIVVIDNLRKQSTDIDAICTCVAFIFMLD